MSSLEYLSLWNNQLTGGVPSNLGNLSNVLYLDLDYNQLSGSIPPEVGDLANLQTLYLCNNQLSGPIPPELGNLPNLTWLYLYNNQLSGPIPPELGNLSNLTWLVLFDNQLSGSIPPELGNLTNLKNLYLNNNQLTGSIPPELGNLTNMRNIYLPSNNLVGLIPPELGNMSNLLYLDLFSNQLSGSIPLELGNLGNLMQLDLGSNQLSGSIPFEIGNLVNLIHLNLNDNLLSGDVPASFTNLVNLCVTGNPNQPCNGISETNLGYNRLNVPAPEPPASFLAIKDPDWYLTQAVEEVIPGDIGGTVVSNDGNTEIDIPAGAAEGLFTILFAPQPDPSQDIGVLNFAGDSFELTAFNELGPVVSFAQPLTLTLQYDQASLGVIPEDSLILYYWDTDLLDWVDAASTCEGGTYTRNLEEDWLSLPICHLSEFALLGDSFDLFLPTIRR